MVMYDMKKWRGGLGGELRTAAWQSGTTQIFWDETETKKIRLIKTHYKTETEKQWMLIL